MVNKRKLTIIISGMAASGKTTLAENLARHYNLKLYAGSDALRDFAKKLGYHPKGIAWWDTKEGIEFLNRRKTDYSFDKKVDDLMIKKAKKGGVVMTSWTLNYLNAPGIKIWLKASRVTRAKRMSRRDGIKMEEAEKVVDERDEKNTKLYRSIYGFTIGKNLKKFHDVIIDADKIDENQVFRKAVKIIDGKFW